MQNIKIEHININDLKLAEYNPRIHNEDMLDRLTQSIQEFGLIDPVIVNSNKDRFNILIGGHARVKVAKELNHQTIPVVYIDLSLEKEKELNVKLNKISGDWDWDKLEELFDKDELIDFGFDTEELSNIWKDKLDTNEDFDIEEELKEIKIPKTKTGDLIILGDHRLVCGDSNKSVTLEKLFDNKKADMIISDPIYNLNINYDKGLGGKRDFGGSVNDKRTEDEYIYFLKINIQNALDFTNEDSHIFYWNTEEQIYIIQTLYKELGIRNRRVCLWIKNVANPTPSVAFSKVYEPCIYGTLGKPYLNKEEVEINQVFNYDSGFGNEALNNINLWTSKRVVGKEMEHATQKPIDLYYKPILRCTKIGDIILDTFGGSGSTLMAGEKTGRKVYMVEKEPVYCDLIIKRWEKLTGEKAIVISD